MFKGDAKNEERFIENRKRKAIDRHNRAADFD